MHRWHTVQTGQCFSIATDTSALEKSLSSHCLAIVSGWCVWPSSEFCSLWLLVAADDLLSLLLPEKKRQDVEEWAPSIQPSTNQFPSQVRFASQEPKPSLFSYGYDIFHMGVLAEILRKLLCRAVAVEVSKFFFSVLEYKSTGTSLQGGEEEKNYWVYRG